MGLVNQVGLGVILEAGGNLSKETLAAVRNLGLLEQAGSRVGGAVTKQTRSMGEAMGGFQRSIAGLSGLLASVGGSISAIALAKIAPAFEHSLQKLRVDLDGTSEYVDHWYARLKQRMLDSANQTTLPLDQMATAMIKLNAELGPQGAENAYLTIVKMAKTGIKDVESAADALSILMQKFNTTPERIGDLVLRTSQKTHVDMNELLETARYSATNAVKFGMSIEDVFRSIAFFRAQGFKDKLAGMALQNSLDAIVNYKNQINEAAKSTSESFRDDLFGRREKFMPVTDKEGEFLPYLTIIQNLRDFLKVAPGQTKLNAEQLGYIAKHFGQSADALGQAVLNVDKMVMGMDNVDGALDRAADRADDVVSKFDKMKQNLHALWIETDASSKSMGDAFDKGIHFIDKARAFFKEHPEWGQAANTTIKSISAVVAVGGLIGTGFGIKRLLGLGRGAAAAGTAAAVGGATESVLLDQFGRALPIAGKAVQGASRGWLGKLAGGLRGGAGMDFFGAMSFEEIQAAVRADTARRRGDLRDPRRALTPFSDPMLGFNLNPAFPMGQPLPDIPSSAVRDHGTSGGALYDYSSTRIVINQLPGEDGNKLAQRVVKILDDARAFKPRVRE